MFRRKEENELNSGETTNTTDSVVPPVANPFTNTTSATTAAARPAEAPKAPVAPAASTAASYRPAAPSAARLQERGPAQPANASNQKTSNKRVLTVGNDILLKGEIATCDRLVIEGKVDATLKDVHTVELAQTGSFKGTAEVEDAEISGLFEGELVVRNRLVIYSTGKVRGTITYGEIEIERGGELTGEIKTGGATASANARKAA